jgi:hypothetical protein
MIKILSKIRYTIFCYRRRRHWNKLESHYKVFFEFMGIDPKTLEKKESKRSEYIKNFA